MTLIIASLPGYSVRRFAIRADPIRVTTRPDYFDEHSDSLELRSPGSPSFPTPEAEATQQELAGISISTLLKPLGS
jgi:hypothetical protein